VSPHRQDRWLQQAAYLAWRSPRVELLTQYLWRDEPCSGDAPTAAGSSACVTRAGAKPSLAHFDTPFVLDAARGWLWGQVRPGGAHELVVERRQRGGSWRTFAHVRTDARGYWTLRRRLSPGAAYRYRVDRTTSAVRRR
jgi:hypothetical protein